MFDKVFQKRDNVNHPSHYNEHPSGVETIEIARELPFDLGNAWKYLMRFRYKGTPSDDLKKAFWYVNDYIEYMYKKPGEKAKSIKQQMYINNEQFQDDLLDNDVTAKMFLVINAEKDSRVKDMLELVATLSVYGTSQFINVPQVLDNFKTLIPEITKEEEFEHVCEDAAEILGDLDKDDKARQAYYKRMERKRKANEEKVSTNDNVDKQTDACLREMLTALKDVNDPVAEIPEFEHRDTKFYEQLSGAIDNAQLVKVLVNENNQVIPANTEMDSDEGYRAELVKVPADIIAQGHDAAVAYAEKIVADGYGAKIIETGSIETDSVEQVSDKTEV